MSKKFRTTRDIVIPAGTEAGPAPARIDFVTEHASVTIPLSKDSTAELLLDVEEAEDLGLVEKVEDADDFEEPPTAA